MCKFLKGIMVLAALLTVLFLSNKAIDNYEYYSRLDILEDYVDVNYGIEYRIDYDNLLINDKGFITNILDTDGNHVSPLIGYF